MPYSYGNIHKKNQTIDLHDIGAAFVFLKLLTLEKYGGVTSIGTLKSSCASKICKENVKVSFGLRKKSSNSFSPFLGSKNSANQFAEFFSSRNACR